MVQRLDIERTLVQEIADVTLLSLGHGSGLHRRRRIASVAGNVHGLGGGVGVGVLVKIHVSW